MAGTASLARPILTRRSLGICRATRRSSPASSRPPVFARASHPRHASTSTSASTAASVLTTRLKNALIGSALVFSGAAGYLYLTDTRAGVHRWLAVPLLRALYPDAEDAHHAGVALLQNLHHFHLHPRERSLPDDSTANPSSTTLRTEVFGHPLDGPIGIAAGLDKEGAVPDPLLALGASIVEIGGVTPHPQNGNPRPRVFRLPARGALINRYGLNSEGADHVAGRLRHRVRAFARTAGFGLDEAAERAVLDGAAGVPPGSLEKGKLLAVQVAKNAWTAEGDVDAVTRDYVYGVERLARYADIVVVNVSSPNTPGLRSLQRVEPLTQILAGVVNAARAVERRTAPAVMVKVSPDEDGDEDVAGICDAVWRAGVDGVIVGNTTTRRPEPVRDGSMAAAREDQLLREHGGYSGPDTFDRTLALVRRYRKALDEGPRGDDEGSTGPRTSAAFSQPSKVIFASGGISDGQQALQVLNAGASVAMLYTAMTYGGVGTISRMKDEMRREIQRK